MNDALVELKKWADATRLRTNSNKTKVVLYLPRGKALRGNNVCFGNEIIEIAGNVKTLGVIFSKNLTWNDHVDYIQFKMSSVVGIINKMRHILPEKNQNTAPQSIGILHSVILQLSLGYDGNH